MVRRGSAVRVRQRALQKRRKPALFVSAGLAESPVCGGMEPFMEPSGSERASIGAKSAAIRGISARCGAILERDDRSGHAANRRTTVAATKRSSYVRRVLAKRLRQSPPSDSIAVVSNARTHAWRMLGGRAETARQAGVTVRAQYRPPPWPSPFSATGRHDRGRSREVSDRARSGAPAFRNSRERGSVEGIGFVFIVTRVNHTRSASSTVRPKRLR